MKIISLITAGLLIAIVILAAVMVHDGKCYDRGFMDGYRQKQIESLPAPGVERVKGPDAGLILKGGRG